MDVTLVDKLLELINQKYGSLVTPHFRFTNGEEVQQMYRPVADELSKQFTVEDVSEPNIYVGVAYAIEEGERGWLLEISFLGPYAVLIHETHKPPITRQNAADDAEKNIVQIVEDFGITLLDQSILEIPIELTLSDAVPGHTFLYQALIADVALVPWRSKVNNWWPIQDEVYEGFRKREDES